MTRSIQEPTAIPMSDPDLGTQFRHPAYAQLRASRVSSSHGILLYGSDLRHTNFIAVTIAASSLTRSLSRDWHHAENDLIEVTLSESQWATFVSSLNLGSGIPATLTRYDGRLIPGLPERDIVHEFKNEVRDAMTQATTELDAALAALETADTKTWRKAVMERVAKARQHLSANLPFVADQFDHHAEAVVEAAKAEVAAHVQATLLRAGITDDPPPVQLIASSVI